MTIIDIKLCEWATVRQLEYIDAVNAHGSMRKAAKAMGVGKNSVASSMNSLKMLAASKGYSPDHHLTRPIAPGLKLRGTSMLYKPGQDHPALEWIKTTVDDSAREQMLRDFANQLCEDIRPLDPMEPPAGFLDSDLLCVVPMGDPHFGMRAWWEDAGDNFDLAAADKLTRAAVDRLMATGPAAETALLLNLGDMFHADNQTNISKSGHALDVDGRWAKVQRVGLEAMIHCIRRMLEKHKFVIVRINRGNHDGHSSYALSMMLACYFSAEPRVTVDISPAPMWYYQHGECLIGSTHGDTIKGPDMIGIMAADMPAEWGSTRHRAMYVGHVHHQDVKEYRGGTVEYFRTLAARDAWHQGQGYRAGRDMRLIVLHKKHGEIERHRCDVGILA